MNDSLRHQINSSLRQETPYDTIIKRIESGVNEVLEHYVKYKIQGGQLGAHHKDKNEKNSILENGVPR